MLFALFMTDKIR